MELYKTIRALTLATVVSILPYACNNGCSYSHKQTDAATVEVKQEARQNTESIESLLR